MQLLCLPSATSDLREEKVYAERSILVLQEAFQFGDLLAQHIWCVADAADHTKTACIGDCCCEFRTGSHVHSGKNDRVVDLQEISNRCAELLYRGSVSMSPARRPRLHTWRCHLRYGYEICEESTVLGVCYTFFERCEDFQ